MGKGLGRLVAGWIGLALTAPAFALNAAEEARITALINAGQIAQARAVLAALPHDRAEALLLEGRILKASGDLTGAEAPLRAALALRPDDLRIRRELAHLLFLAGKNRQASHHLTILQASDPAPALQRGYRKMQRELAARTPLTFKGFLEIAPSTNINAGSGHRYVQTVLGPLPIDDDSRAQSGIGLRFGGQAQYRAALADSRSLTFGLTATRLFYPKAASENETTARLSVSYGQAGQMPWRLGPFVARSWTGDEEDIQRVGVNGALRFAPQRDRALTLSGSLAQRRDVSEAGDVGPEWQLGLSYQQSYSAAGHWSVAIQADGFPGAEKAHNRHKGGSLTLGMQHEWPGGVITGLSVFAGKRQFEGTAPLQTSARSDRIVGLTGSVQMTRQQVFGLSPVITCKVARNTSNVALYSYDQTGCGLRLSRDF